jgi:MFS family permease
MDKLSSRLTVGFASVAHSYSHLFILLYATVVLALEREWGMSYAELFALSLPMSVMFGAAALPAGWLGDRWSAAGMIAVFFIGTGAAALVTGLADSPLGIAIGLTLIGTFAAIYHPVGIPWLVKNAANHGRALGVNGVFGSAGTAGAALVAGFLADYIGWRAAFVVPGVICLLTGLGFVAVWRLGLLHEAAADVKRQAAPTASDIKRVFIVMSVTMLCTGLIYQVTSFALPKLFDERLGGIFHDSVFGIGGMVTLVYTASALSQVIGGELADRFSLKGIYVLVQYLQLPVVAVAYLLYDPVLVGAAALMVSLNVAGQPAENALLARYTPPGWRGRAFGAKFVLTLGVSALGVALIPLVHGLTGTLDALFGALALFALVAGLAALLLPGGRGAPAAVTVPAESPLAAE